MIERGVAAGILGRFPALRSPDYRRLFYNAVFSSGSHWAMLLARGWLVHDMTGSSTAVGAVTFGGMAPFLFATPIAGALADRHDRRRLALAGSAIGFVAAMLLAALVLAGAVQVWHVVALALLGGLARAIQTPAEQSMIPNLVPREHLLNAVGLSSISQHGSRLVGPLMGTLMLKTLGAGWVFALAGVLVLIGATQLWRITYRFVRETPEGAPAAATAPRERGFGGALGASTREVMSDIGEGFAYLGQDRRVTMVIALVVFHCALTMAFDSMMPGLATLVGGAEGAYGSILMGLGGGALIGTVTIATLPSTAAKGPALVVVSAGSGLAMLVLGLAPTPGWVVAGAVVAGATQAGFMALSAALIQEATPDALRGRVMSIYVMLAAGHMAFVNLGFGAAADIIGVRPLLVVPGLIWTGIFVLAVLLLAELRHLIRRGEFRELAREPVPATPAGVP